MRRKSIQKNKADGRITVEPATDRLPSKLDIYVERMRNRINMLSRNMVPGKNHEKLIEHLAQNVDDLEDKAALIAVAKYSGRLDASKALAKLAYEEVKAIAGVPVPDDYGPGFRMARERLIFEAREDFESCTIIAAYSSDLAAANWASKKLDKLVDSGLVKNLEIIIRYSDFFERQCGELVELAIGCAKNELAYGNNQDNELLNILEWMASGALSKNPSIERLAIEALSGIHEFVGNERTLMALAVRGTNDSVRKTSLERLCGDHAALAELAEEGIEDAFEKLKSDFDDVTDEKALILLAKRYPELKSEVIWKLEPNSLGPFLEHDSALRRALASTDRLGSDFEHTAEFILRAAKMIGTIENPAVLQMIFRHHPSRRMIREALGRLENMVEKIDDENILKDIAIFSANNEAKIAAIGKCRDTGYLMHCMGEARNEPLRNAIVERFGVLATDENCEDPMKAIAVVLSFSKESKMQAAALRRLLGIVSGQEKFFWAYAGQGVHYEVECLPEISLHILTSQAREIALALRNVKQHDAFEAAVLINGFSTVLSEWGGHHEERSRGLDILKNYLERNMLVVN